MPVQGFHINEDGERVAMSYSGHVERTWCKCSELLDHKHYAEAHKKLQEYHEANGNFINKRDWEFILKVELGYLNVKATKKSIDHILEVWKQAVWNDGGSHQEELLDMLTDILNHHIKIHKIPLNENSWDEFDKVTTQTTIVFLDFLCPILETGADHDMDLEDRDYLCPVIHGVRNLAKNGEKKKAAAYFDKVKKLGYGCYSSSLEEAKDFMMGDADDW